MLATVVTMTEVEVWATSGLEPLVFRMLFECGKCALRKG